MKAICIDDENKPPEIPEEEWIEAGVVYTVRSIVRLGFQAGKYGVLLKEVELSSKSMPYESYDAERFIIFPFDIEIENREEYFINTDSADLSKLN